MIWQKKTPKTNQPKAKRTCEMMLVMMALCFFADCKQLCADLTAVFLFVQVFLTKNFYTICHFHLLDNKNMLIHRSGYEWMCGIKVLLSLPRILSPLSHWVYITILILPVSSHVFPSMISLWEYNVIQFLSVHNKGGQFLKWKHNEEYKKPPPSCTIATELKAVSKYTACLLHHQHLHGRKPLSWYA